MGKYSLLAEEGAAMVAEAVREIVAEAVAEVVEEALVQRSLLLVAAPALARVVAIV